MISHIGKVSNTSTWFSFRYFDRAQHRRETPDAMWTKLVRIKLVIWDKRAMQVKATTRESYFLAVGGMYLIISLASSLAMSLRLGLMNI